MQNLSSEEDRNKAQSCRQDDDDDCDYISKT